MTKINSKAKGSSYERLIANLFSDKLAPLNFHRSMSSGAFLGGMNKHRTSKFSTDKAELLTGDIYSSDHNIRFNIECKNYKESIPFHHFFTETCIVKKWFAESKYDADAIGKEPMLIFKFNRTPTFVAMLKKECSWTNNVMLINDLAVMTSETFFENVTHEFFLESK